MEYTTASAYARPRIPVKMTALPGDTSDSATTRPQRSVSELEAENSRLRKELASAERDQRIYITQEEAGRLYIALQQSETPMLKHIVPMLILTGARKREVLDACWSDIDLAKLLWRIPITKSGKARHVPLSEGVVAVLAQVPVLENCPWIFANPETRKPFVSIYYGWHSTRVRAGLSDVRMHVRHCFASFLINNGMNALLSCLQFIETPFRGLLRLMATTRLGRLLTFFFISFSVVLGWSATILLIHREPHHEADHPGY